MFIAVHTTLSHYNIVQISYVYQLGLLSASEFTDMDATVVCRENNFQSGLALRHLRPSFHSHNIYWLRNASCVGTEARIGDCPNAGRVGKLGRFDDKVAAAVACFNTKGSNQFYIRKIMIVKDILVCVFFFKIMHVHVLQKCS